jgi:hypothetical protein
MSVVVEKLEAAEKMETTTVDETVAESKIVEMTEEVKPANTAPEEIGTGAAELPCEDTAPAEGEKEARKTYDKNEDLDNVMDMTVKTMRALPHVVEAKATTKNNRHYVLHVKSNVIADLFIHGINIIQMGNDKDRLLEAMELIVNHWNDNLGIVPDNSFMVCVIRLQLDARLREVEPKKSAILADEAIRKQIYSHYTNSRYVGEIRSVIPAIEMAEELEAKTRYGIGSANTRIKYDDWTPALEDMEDYFGLKESPFHNVIVPEGRLRQVGITLKVLGVRNPRIIGHLVKINAMRTALLRERAAAFHTGVISISAPVVDTKTIDAEELRQAMLGGGK